MEIHIPIYSIYKTKHPDKTYEEIIKKGSEFTLVRMKTGKIILRKSLDSKEYLEILLLEEHDDFPLLLGQISKKEIIEFFNIKENDI